MDCLTTETARLTAVVKGMEMGMTKETSGIESQHRKKDMEEQCNDKKDEERSLTGGKVTPKKKWRKNNINHNILEGYRAERDSSNKKQDRRGEKYRRQEDR